MSRAFTAQQFEQSYRPSRLGNWEVPKSTAPATPTFRGAGYTTKILVDDRGHLLPGKARKASADDAPMPQMYRWPEKRLLSQEKYTGAATMGCVARAPHAHARAAARTRAGALSRRAARTALRRYKGVPTDFLPISSVNIKTVPGTREYPYAQPI